ncbi:hypothetical protein [Sorangium sp. So ce362]|uniref:hypothetical protein n=1 Tax=Sorangium sp. So ce362 TaxID=3133303 RepID=UPI003F6343DE
MPLPESSLERVGLMADRALASAMRAANDPEVTPSALKELQAEARQWEALRAKLRGEGGRIPPLHEHPEYPAFVELVLDAVDTFPGAAERLLEVLRARRAEAAQEAA